MIEYQKYNINNQCKVKLTANGVALLDHKRAQLRERSPTLDWSRWHMPDDEGYLKLELWGIMQLFGEHIRMGGPNPIHTEILIEVHRD